MLPEKSALFWMTPATLQGHQTLLHRLCWLTPPWMALSDWRVPTCLLSESIPSHLISFSMLLVPPVPTWAGISLVPPAGMRQQPSCAPVPDDAGLLWITLLLQRYKYFKLEQESNSMPGSHKLGQNHSHCKLLHQEPAPGKTRPGVPALAPQHWAMCTEGCGSTLHPCLSAQSAPPQELLTMSLPLAEAFDPSVVYRVRPKIRQESQNNTNQPQEQEE